jgi:membrane associated rhomboid family serine protease
MFPIKSTIPLRYPPLATWGLIAANGVVFLFELTLDPFELSQFFAHFALIPARYFQGGSELGPTAYFPFITNMFLHSGWLHVIVNMWTLWLFGPAIEDRMGSARYLAFYFVCGLLASITHAVFNPSSIVPALGASGAIAGVLGCYMRLYPFARVIVLMPLLFFPFFFDLPAIAFAGFWFVMQLLQGTASIFTDTADGVAWWAHVGGFLAGYLLAASLGHPRRAPWPRYADEGILGFDLTGR